MKKKILIVTKSQFGYLVDTLKYCQYLNKEFDITFLSWDFGLPKVEQKGIKIKYLERKGNKLKRYLQFLWNINAEVRSSYYDLIFFVYFPGCSISKILNPHKTFNLDIRTASVVEKNIINWFSDKILKVESAVFKNITVISDGVAERLGIKTYHLLPLGGESFCSSEKDFSNLHLLYVGTLENRNMISCVIGFHDFLKENIDKNIEFTIIGDTPANELQEIRDYISKNQLEKFIHITGYIPNTLVSPYFERANIGVSFVPMTKYYEHQPPTKTFEYLLSGMPVIATRTAENAKVINTENGILIEDHSESFKEGLKNLIKKLSKLNSSKIRKNSGKFHWKKITDDILKNYIESISL